MTRKVPFDRSQPRRNSYRATREKKAGGGQHNWGNVQDELEDLDIELGKTYTIDSPIMQKSSQRDKEDREEKSRK